MASGARPEFPSATDLSAVQIRAQLEKILASETFVRSERLSGFLRYVVEMTLEGNGHILKEQTIAQDLFGRGSDFEGAADPIVRVEARRLRDKLREYYAGARNESVLITLPKGGYVPAFERNPAITPVIVPKPEPVVLPSRRRWPVRMLWLAGTLVLILLVIAGVIWSAFRSSPVTPFQIRHLTSLPGNESMPSLSPDGNFVVMAWSNGGPADLYVKAVDHESLRRLTDTPDDEFSPAWSPDGSRIAFVRRPGGRVFVISALGGPERRISDGANVVQWSADSRSVFVIQGCPGATEARCIFQVILDTLEKRQITNPPFPGEWRFAVSPDGRTLAVIRAQRGGLSDIYVVPLAREEGRRITTQNRFVSSVAWTPDSKHLFYSVLDGMRFQVWRTAATGGGNGEPVTALGESASELSISRTATGDALRLVYPTKIHDVGLRLVELDPAGPTSPVGSWVPFADVTEGRDCSAKFSPDARQIAFNSARSGQSLLWLANRDGSSLRSLTTMIAQEIKPRGWSPDGRHIAFDVAIDGNSDIYITDLNGTQPFRLTSEPSLEVLPSWSADGRWIYFSSDRSGSAQIWKAPAKGGTAVQLTFEGGWKPQASMDGEYVYYSGGGFTGSGRPAALKRVKAGGGDESVVIEGVLPWYWTVTRKGVYLLSVEQGEAYLDRFDPDVGQRTRLGILPFPPAVGHCRFLDVSQDGRYLITNHVDRDESNLRLVDGLR